jgi:alpha,alpha-trehalase
MSKTLCLFLALWSCAATLTAQTPQPPDRLYGPLFKAVQLSGIFRDNKTFVDAVPRQSPAQVMAAYEAAGQPTKSALLRAFVTEHFLLPDSVNVPAPFSTRETSVTAHINRLWTVLQRDTTHALPYSSLLNLPYPYIVPGGRFREIYYWDSYFTMLGLEESNRIDIIENMIKNFAYLLTRYGHIPNGNRTYFLSRSQPPFFSLMLDILAQHKGDSIYITYLPELEKEYAYWTDKTAPTKHVVKMPDGSLLNRYYDQDNIPRQEAYKEDVAVAARSSNKYIYRELRSGAESGWDFSSRWFSNDKDLSTIRVTQFVPVDLNALLYHLELTLAKAQQLAGNPQKAAQYKRAAQKRKAGIEKYCWSAGAGWYVDYDLEKRRPSTAITLAGMYPLFTKAASPKHIAAIQQVISKRLLKNGGVATTLVSSGQQWDAPNGWAPLQWITIAGLENYGATALAREIAQRWAALNIRVYNTTGKLMEKYNVTDTSLVAGGGEYPTQDGFGWTNGVLLKLLHMYKLPEDESALKAELLH